MADDDINKKGCYPSIYLTANEASQTHTVFFKVF